jgi:hypothetical protein
VVVEIELGPKTREVIEELAARARARLGRAAGSRPSHPEDESARDAGAPRLPRSQLAKIVLSEDDLSVVYTGAMCANS